MKKLKRIPSRKLKEVLCRFLLSKHSITVCPKCLCSDLSEKRFCLEDRFGPAYYTRKCHECGEETRTEKLLIIELTKARVKKILGL